jgi:acetyl esterase/lipase
LSTEPHHDNHLLVFLTTFQEKIMNYSYGIFLKLSITGFLFLSSLPNPCSSGEEEHHALKDYPSNGDTTNFARSSLSTITLSDLRAAGMRPTSHLIPMSIYRKLKGEINTSRTNVEIEGKTCSYNVVSYANGDIETHYYHGKVNIDPITMLSEATYSLEDVMKTLPIEGVKELMHPSRTDIFTFIIFEDDQQEIYKTLGRDKRGKLVSKNKANGEEKILLTIPVDCLLEEFDLDGPCEIPKLLFYKDPVSSLSIAYILTQDVEGNAYLIDSTTHEKISFLPATQDIFHVLGTALYKNLFFYLIGNLLAKDIDHLRQLLVFDITSKQHRPLLVGFGKELIDFGILDHNGSPSSWISYREGFDTLTMRFTGLFEGDAKILNKGSSILGSSVEGEFIAQADGPFTNIYSCDTATQETHLLFSERDHLTAQGFNPDGLSDLLFTLRFCIPDKKGETSIPTIGFFPHGIGEGEKIPAIIHVHGGPELFTDETSTYRDFLVNHLKVALFCLNVRGSTGFGWEHFLKARGRLDDVLNDVITSWHFVADLPFIDPSHIFMLGESWGGSLTGLILTSPHGALFKGGISISGIYDWSKKIASDVTAGGGEDLAQTWMRRLGIGDPRKDAPLNRSLSSALRLEEAKAPWLIIHGTADRTVPSEQADLVEAWCKSNPTQANILVKYIEGGGHQFANPLHEEMLVEEISSFLKALIKGTPVRKVGVTNIQATLNQIFECNIKDIKYDITGIIFGYLGNLGMMIPS